MAPPRASLAIPVLVLAALAAAPEAAGFVAQQTSHPAVADAQAALRPLLGVYDPDTLATCLAVGDQGPFVDPLPYYATLRLAVYGGVEVRNRDHVDLPLPPPLDDCAGLVPGQHLMGGDLDSHAGHAVWQTTVEQLPMCLPLPVTNCRADYRVYEWSSCAYTQGLALGIVPGLPAASASKVACTNELCAPLHLVGRHEVHYGMYVWLHNGSSHETDGVPHVGLPDHGPHAHEHLQARHLCEPEELVGGVWVDRNAVVQVCLEIDHWDFILGATVTAYDQDHFALLNSEADPLDTAAFLQATALDPSTWSNLQPDLGC